MEGLYALYDALIGINVPGDKARAVVQAMERDMTTLLATKSDLELFRQGLQAEVRVLRQGMETGSRELRFSLIIWLGSAQVVTAGVLFAALQLTMR